MMVLLVTADPEFTRSFARRLASSGHRTATVRDAAQAQAEVERLHPDVVLVDGTVRDDAQLLQRLQPATPTILLLNRSSLDDVLAAVDAIAPADDLSAAR